MLGTDAPQVGLSDPDRQATQVDEIERIVADVHEQQDGPAASRVAPACDLHPRAVLERDPLEPLAGKPAIAETSML